MRPERKREISPQPFSSHNNRDEEKRGSEVNGISCCLRACLTRRTNYSKLFNSTYLPDPEKKQLWRENRLLPNKKLEQSEQDLCWPTPSSFVCIRDLLDSSP